MAYFVVERSRDDGSLAIPLPDAYETRDAAIAALSAATAAGEIHLKGEVFIADLGIAVPVLLMPSMPASAAMPAEPVSAVEPDLPAEESEPEVVVELSEPADVPHEPVPAEEPAELEEGDADAVFSSWEPIAETAGAESTLADALKRAATSLEEEGIVAPDSIVSAEAAGDVGEEASADEELVVPAVQTGAESPAWPWTNVEAYEITTDAVEVPGAEDEEAPIEPEVPAGEAPAEAESVVASAGAMPEEQSIITSAPAEGEEAFMPHPVILGDYMEGLDASGAGEPEEPAAEVAVLEDARPGESAAVPVDEPSPVEPPGDDVAALSAPEDIAPGDAELLERVPEVGYEATGELKLEEYTCQDCVYSNTCPKVGQTTPAECGSFQWRSE